MEDLKHTTKKLFSKKLFFIFKVIIMKESKVTLILTIFFILSLLNLPLVNATCEQNLTYTYTNNEPVVHRIGFAIIDRNSELSVSFYPSPLEVRPGETREFIISGSSKSSLDNPYVYFQIRKNALPVGEYNATFTLCDSEDKKPLLSGTVPIGRILIVLGILFIVIVGAFFVLNMDAPRKPRRHEKKEVSKKGIERTKIDVDSLVESYEFKPHEEPKLSMVLVVLLIIFIVLVLGLILMLILTQNPTPLNTIPTSSLP